MSVFRNRQNGDLLTVFGPVADYYAARPSEFEQVTRDRDGEHATGGYIGPGATDLDPVPSGSATPAPIPAADEAPASQDASQDDPTPPADDASGNSRSKK